MTHPKNPYTSPAHVRAFEAGYADATKALETGKPSPRYDARWGYDARAYYKGTSYASHDFKDKAVRA